MEENKQVIAPLNRHEGSRPPQEETTVQKERREREKTETGVNKGRASLNA